MSVTVIKIVVGALWEKTGGGDFEIRKRIDIIHRTA